MNDSNRRDFLKSIGALGVWAALPRALRAATATATAGGAKPNIIFVMSDDQGWDHMGYMGHSKAKTPNLDAMAANGLRFDRFYAACPKCSPTRASVMTGRHPFHTGERGSLVKRKELTVPQVLKQAGYFTGHFGKWHLGQVSADDVSNPKALGFDYARAHYNTYDFDPVFTDETGTEHQLKGEGSIATIDECLKFIDEAQKRKQPFFANVWFGSPHGPYNPSYFGEIEAMDQAIGNLREGLRKRGLADNTLIWFCSDNGYAGTRDDHTTLRGGKLTCWEGGIRVPGVMEWPARIKPGTRTDVIASTMDVLPTAAAMAGVTDLKTVGPLDGVNLLPLFDGQMKERPQILPFAWSGPVGYMDNRYKICKGNPAAKEWKKDKDSWYLYDLVEDVGEEHNLATEKPELLAKMQATLQKWINQK